MIDVQDFKNEITKIGNKIKIGIQCANLPEKEVNIAKLKVLTEESTFWDDAQNAGKISQELAELEKSRNLWVDLEFDISNIVEMLEILELDCAENDIIIETSDDFLEIVSEFDIVQKASRRAEQELLLSGEFDSRNALLEITSGAGGTEAQDYAEMLLRMYLRFCERKNWTVEILERSNGTEAGIKSCLLEIKGYNAFGLLMAEKGTHRLVRQSPFNAKNLRQTSFAGVMITPELEDADVANIVIPDSEIRIDTFRSSGSGGQHANKTDSAVRMLHIPTKLTVVCESQRSQHQNKEKAMQILKSRIVQRMREEEEKKAAEVRGEHTEAAWGTQIRNYVLHPYKLVKDLRTGYEVTNPDLVFDGDLDEFHQKFLEWKAGTV